MAASTAAVPAAFVDLVAAKSAPVNTFVNIIGLVVDIMPPMRNRSGQWQLTFKLLDLKMRDSVDANANHGLTVRFFRAQERDLPQVKAHGDIALLRQIKMSKFNHQDIALSNWETNHLVFPSAQIPAPGYAMAYMSGTMTLPCLGKSNLASVLTPEVQDYVISLKSLFSEVRPTSAQASSSKPTPAPKPPPDGRPSHKFKVIRELQHMDFADLKVEVVKKYPLPDGNCELYVTDYSVNKRVFCYKPPEEARADEPGQPGDEFGYNGRSKTDFPGPYGQLVLKVNVKQPHAEFAVHHVNVGHIVHLQNLKGKIMSHDTFLEGDMWPDSSNPDKVQISIITQYPKEVRDMLGRKNSYWHDRKIRGLIPQPEPPATEAAAVIAPVQGGSSRNAEKKKRKKKKAQEKKAAEEDAAKAEVQDISKTNAHVRCGHRGQAASSFEQILDLENTRHTNTLPSGETYVMPFVNANYRTTARVVDFSPDDLGEFTLYAEPEPEEASEFSQEAGWNSSPRWEWDFSLQLEEVSTGRQLWANVGHREAQHLFGNSMNDPADLFESPPLLKKLREKLCILWGDVEEKKKGKKRKVGEKGEEPSNRPFDLCLAEYGDLAEGGHEADMAAFERKYMMHSVTIL